MGLLELKSLHFVLIYNFTQCPNYFIILSSRFFSCLVLNRSKQHDDLAAALCRTNLFFQKEPVY